MYHEGKPKQVGLLVPPPMTTVRKSSKSPSPINLAIISNFIENRRQKEKGDKEKTPINIVEPINKKANESIIEKKAHEIAFITATEVTKSSSSVIQNGHFESSVIKTPHVIVEPIITTVAAANESIVQQQAQERATVTTMDIVNAEESSSITQSHLETSVTSSVMSSVIPTMTCNAMTSNDSMMNNAMTSNGMKINPMTSNVMTSDALTSDAMTSNAMTSNVMTSNAMTSNAMTCYEMTSNEMISTAMASNESQCTTQESLSAENNSAFEKHNVCRNVTANEYLMNVEHKSVVNNATVETENSLEQSLMTAHEQTVNNEYFESSTMEMKDLHEEYFVTNSQETKVMEELFDKLVAEENVKVIAAEKPIKKCRSFDSIEKWLMKSDEPIEIKSVQDHDKTNINTSYNKLREKRNRNKSIDYSSLPNDNWYNVTATCSSKTYSVQNESKQPFENFKFESEEANNNATNKVKLSSTVQTSSDTDNSSEPDTPNSGLSSRNKPGLCLIIDKLKSIETKLDELKTYDTNAYCPYGPESPLLLLPEVGETPTNHPGSLESSQQECPPSEKHNLTAETLIFKTHQNGSETLEPEEADDDTLKDEDMDVNSATTDVSHTTELLVDDANVVIVSPLPTPCPDDKSKINELKKLGGQPHAAVDIMSIHTMSEVDEADDEDEEEDLSSGRQSRIEELAKKIMEEKAHLSELEKQELRKRDPINLNAELDTVSERSEVDEEDSLQKGISIL